MKYQVTKIEVEFSKGSFEEWATINCEETDYDYISLCEKKYNEEIEFEIRKIYPNAKVSVGEGCDQQWSTKYYIYTSETEENEDYEYNFSYLHDGYAEYIMRDDVISAVEDCIGRVGQAGSFWL